VALQKFQYPIEAGHLYVVTRVTSSLAYGQNQPNIYIKGVVDVYGSNSARVPTSKEEMDLPNINRRVTGINTFEVVPVYLYCDGNAEEIVLTGIEPIKDLGPL